MAVTTPCELFAVYYDPPATAVKAYTVRFSAVKAAENGNSAAAPTVADLRKFIDEIQDANGDMKQYLTVVSVGNSATTNAAAYDSTVKTAQKVNVTLMLNSLGEKLYTIGIKVGTANAVKGQPAVIQDAGITLAANP